MRRFFVLVALLSVLSAASLSVLGAALFSRFEKGSQQFQNIQSLARAQCLADNEIRLVLRNEHKIRLERTKQYLRDHPNGTRDIPLRLLLQGLQDERVILSHVKPHNCP